MMVGESGTSHTGDKHYYYKCAGAKRKLGCKKKSVKKDFIERAAVILTVNRVLRDEEISRIADSILALQAGEDTTIPALKKQLADTERGIENMLNAIQKGVLTSSTKERLEALEKQRDNLKIAVLQAELQKPKYTNIRYAYCKQKRAERRMFAVLYRLHKVGYLFILKAVKFPIVARLRPCSPARCPRTGQQQS